MNQINCEKRKAIRLKTPAGQFGIVYDDMSNQVHMLIAGTTGSGKSVVMNGIIHSILMHHSYLEACIVLIDPKRVELVQWKNTANCIYYASEPMDIIEVLQNVIGLIERRYKKMQDQGVKLWTGSDIYVFIDELADLMTTVKSQVLPLIQRICQIGRAAKVHVVAGTQCPISDVARLFHNGNIYDYA